jgi:hypothetical protein
VIWYVLMLAKRKELRADTVVETATYCRLIHCLQKLFALLAIVNSSMMLTSASTVTAAAAAALVCLRATANLLL